MAEVDVITARREARRRRILENSEHRLKKITGVCKTGGDGSVPDIQIVHQFASAHNDELVSDIPREQNRKDSSVLDSEESSSLKTTLHDGSTNLSTLQPSVSEENSKESSSITSVSNCEKSSRENAQAEAQPVLQTLLSARLHLVGLAAIVRILLSVNYGFLFAESAFVPLFSLELAEYAVKRTASEGGPPSGMLGAALLLSGIAPQRIALMNSMLCTLQRCLQDFYLYFFTFIVAHICIEILR